MATLTVDIPDWAVPLYDVFRYKVLFGGRSSGKTWAIAQALVVQGHADPLRIICVREHQKALKLSAKPAITNMISKMGLWARPGVPGYVERTDAIRHTNGTWFSFEGASTSTEEDIKGWEGVQRCWFEEAHMMSRRSRDLIFPTIFRREDSEFWASFNPASRADTIYRDFVAGDWGLDTRYVRHVNFNDNPWFPPAEEQLRLEWERSDPQSYAHHWLGVPDDGDGRRQVLPYDLLSACVEAYRKGMAPPYADAPVTDMGLDIAEGGRDKCAQVIRVGPRVEFVDEWPGVVGDLSLCASRCHDHARPYEVNRLYYDGASPIKTEFERLEPDYAVRSVLFGGVVGGKDRLYEPRRTNEQIFRNRGIQMADAVRLRAMRTVALLKGDDEIDPLDCLFIRPDLNNIETFLADCTQPTRRQSPQTGKWELDKRGGDENAESPDRFDALELAFARDSEHGLRARGGVS